MIIKIDWYRYPSQCIDSFTIFPTPGRRSFKERKQTGLGDELAKILTSSPGPSDRIHHHSPSHLVGKGHGFMPFGHFKAHRNAEFEANGQLSGCGHMSGLEWGMCSQTCIISINIICTYMMHKHLPWQKHVPVYFCCPMKGPEGWQGSETYMFGLHKPKIRL